MYLARSKPPNRKEILQQKLIDAQVNVDDPKVKEFVNKQAGPVSERMGELAEEYVRGTMLSSRSEDKVTFELKPLAKSLDNLANYKTIYLSGLVFRISLRDHYNDHYKLIVDCRGLPAGRFCRAIIEVTIKNQAGKRDFLRTFSKKFDNKFNQNRIEIISLIEAEEYADQTLGLMKDGKLQVEIAIRIEPAMKCSD